MKKLLVLFLIFTLVGCGSVSFSNDAEESRVVEPTAKYHLATGGVAPGRNELVIYDDDGEIREFQEDELQCSAGRYAGEDIISLAPRPDYDTVSSGSGVKITATGVGYVSVSCTQAGLPIGNPYEVIVPPQELIQIMLAEAGQQIVEESAYNENNTVALDSTSPTARAIAYVVRNRVDLSQEYDNPEIFNADEDEFYQDVPSSYYLAIITAPNQFSPLNEDDPANETYNNAEDRNFLETDLWKIAYDQAVLTASAVFVGDVDDPTGESFGFRSPTADEWTALKEALDSEAEQLPEEGGITDSSFPLFSPLQVLIHPNVWTYPDGRPSFVFVRKRGAYEPAVTDVP